MVCENDRTIAKRWQGWTDGEYNYYKYHGEWYCIEPNTGLSAGRGESRAIARTFADLNASKIAEVRACPEWMEMVARFEAAIGGITA